MRQILLILVMVQAVFILTILYMTRDRLFNIDDMRSSYYYGCIMGHGSNCQEQANMWKKILKQLMEVQ